MARRIAFGALLALGACLGNGAAPAPGSGGINAARHLNAPYVVLVSFDGFRYDYLDRYPAPNFARVQEAGVRAERMIPTFPTKTFPTHYSIATGMYPEHHGLVGNRFWDPERGAGYDMGDREIVEDGSWYRGEPLWVTAEKQGMVAASYFFVGSEADIQGVRPTYWHRYDGSVPNERRVDGVLEWLRLPAEQRPHMITLYFSDTDNAGHRFGPDSPEVAAAVLRVDAALGRLLDGLEALPDDMEVYVILVSDHGMMRARADQVDTLDLSLFPGVRWAEGGPYGNFFVETGGAARLPRVRDSLQAVLRHGAVYLREDVPERLHYRADPRVGDIVAVMEAGGTVSSPARAAARDYFTHGWDNAVTEMGAIFLAMGPGLPAGKRISAFESVNVYPFVTSILGLVPNPEADGRAEVLVPLLGSR
ncbi:MAG: ectonucleotide pyrophosphatase/phosphodiesterase [Gemmatimonadota bacterium]